MQVLCGDEKKSTSGGCFSILVILNLSLRTSLILPHMLGLDIVSFPHSMSLLFFCLIFFQHKKLKKLKIKMQNFFFFFQNFFLFLLIAFQISYVFLLDISIHCALIEYA
jgi:hypothetical protein